MKLTELEAKVLEILGLRGDISYAQVAKLLQAKPHRCRYAIDSLFSRGLLERRVIINAYRLGYTIYGLCFSLSSEGRKERKKVIDYLRNSQMVGYFGEFYGEYEYRIDLYAQSLEELQQFFVLLTEKIGDVFSKKSFLTIYEIWNFPFKALNPKRSDRDGFRIGICKASSAIEERDHKILQRLSQINTDSHATIARDLSIPIASFEYRINKLREQGIIVGYYVWPKVDRLNTLGIRILVHRIRLRLAKEVTKEKVVAFAQKDPSVFSMTRCIGDYDLELCTFADSVADERQFILRLEATFQDALQYRSSSLMIEDLKVTNYPVRGTKL